jgi:hypothetical protein
MGREARKAERPIMEAIGEAEEEVDSQWRSDFKIVADVYGVG